MAQQPEEKKDKELSDSQKKIWTDYLSKSEEAQCDLFLNLYWSDFASEKKENIYTVYSQYVERKKLVGGKVGFGPFNLILENIKKLNVSEVAECMDKYADKSSMGKRFIALGFKMNNNQITLFEMLLFIYGQTSFESCDRAPTPCTKKLRNAQKELLDEQTKQKNRQKEIDDLKKDLDEGKINKMKRAQAQQNLKKMEFDLRQDGVLMRKNLKTKEKNVTLAEEELKKENTTGTEPSNWFKEKRQKFPPK